MRATKWKKSIRIPAALGLLALVFAATLCNVPHAQAVLKVDMQEKGTLALQLPEDESSADMVMDMARIRGADGAADGRLDVHAWKVADMLETGRYELTDAFRGLGVENDEWREMSVSEEGWKSLSAAATALVYELDGHGNPVGEPKIPATYDRAIHVAEDGKLAEPETFTGMDLGLYLIAVDEAQSPKYTYTFTPMIVSLPWSMYQYDETSGGDAWQYRREAFLKPARELRYGSIRIVKTLTEYNVSQGDATFVFDVVARESADADARVVYSNVVSLTFSATGTKEAVLEHIPADAVVTVTEIYSGANCEMTVSDGASKIVTAEGDGDSVSFSFENAYNEEAKNGYGVENRFRYDTERGTYQWTTDRPDIGGGTLDEEAQAGE